MNTVWIVMPILLVLMFLLGTDLNRQAFANVARNPKAVLAGMVGQLVFLPLIAFGISRFGAYRMRIFRYGNGVPARNASR